MIKYYYKNLRSPCVYESILNEIEFNNRWTLITNTDVTNTVAQIISNESDELNNLGNNLVVYQKSDDPTEIITVDKDGIYTVVDHIKYNPMTKDMISGAVLGVSSKPNIGFFSTLVSLYLDSLSRGNPIKVSSVSEKMWKAYNKVLEKVSQKNSNYYLGKEKVEYNDKYNVTVYSRVVIPRGKRNIDYRNKIIEIFQRMESI